MIREVLRMGDPRLLRISQKVEKFDTPELNSLIADMLDTMRHLNGVGLAAPQIGVDLRLVIFGFESSERYPDAAAIPFTVLINPILEPQSTEEEEGWEGCLSVPGLRGWVPRYIRMRYRGFEQHGNLIDRTVEDFHARVVQHECDHLDGILYPMRVRDFARFGFTEELFPDGSVAGDD
jgi:peptide deformylase